LAPPYILALAGQSGSRQLGQLGPFVVASSLAAVTSNYFWGRLSDKSSRKALILSGLVASVALGLAGLLGYTAHESLGTWYLLPAVHFVLMIAYQGVRLGRSIHIVDMASESTRAAYTALSNTIIGIVLIAGGVFGVVAHHYGNSAVLVLFAFMSLLASLVAAGLHEVQQE
jgi:MFS family permease